MTADEIISAIELLLPKVSSGQWEVQDNSGSQF